MFILSTFCNFVKTCSGPLYPAGSRGLYPVSSYHLNPADSCPLSPSIPIYPHLSLSSPRYVYPPGFLLSIG